MAKKRKRSPQGHPATHQAPAASQPIALFSGYDGANWSEARGDVWWPTLDARLELDSFSREELLRRIHWLKANFGFIRGLIRNSADLIGWQTPQSQSGDPEWQDESEEYFRDCTGEAAAFDVAGKFDFDDAQPMLMRESLTNGDMLTVLTKWPDGSPRVAFYGTSQLENPPDCGPSWRGGIQFTSSGRHMAYGIRDSLTGKVAVIPAGSCIYFGEFDSPGEDRPVPPLAHGVNHAHDITEVFAFTKQGIKSASLLGAVREQKENAKPRAKQGLTGTSRVVKDANGNRFKVADVWSGAQIPELDPGETIKLLHDERPSQNVMDFIRTLIRDIAIGWGLPPEVVWEMLRMTGPGVRFVMDVADRWIKCRQKRHKSWGKRVWRYVIACGIQNGDLRMPKKDPKTGREKWWAVSFTSQRNLTIDRGQVSRAKLDELSAGVSTLSDWEEMDGRDWKDRGKQRIREVAWLKAECAEAGLTYAEVFPPRQGAAVPPAAADEPDPKKEKDDKNDTEDEEE
jgi:capsid protein